MTTGVKEGLLRLVEGLGWVWLGYSDGGFVGDLGSVGLNIFLRVAGRWHLVFEVGWLMADGLCEDGRVWMEIGEVL